MKTGKVLALILIAYFLLTGSVSLNTSVQAVFEGDDTRMLMDDGALSGGGGGGSLEKTRKSLVESLKAIFSGKRPNNNTNTNGSSNTNNSGTTDDGETYTPPPNIESAGELQFADNITKLIHDDCTTEGIGVVTKKNTVNSQMLLKKTSCITRASIPLKSGTAEVTNSVTAFYYLQCVACARAMSDARGRSYNGIGSAKEHIGQKVSGYTYFSNKPENYDQLIPGSIGIANEGTYGHIFYITDVIKGANGTPKAYKALECNWGAQGLIRHDKTRPLDRYMAGWQRPN